MFLSKSKKKSRGSHAQSHAITSSCNHSINIGTHRWPYRPCLSLHSFSTLVIKLSIHTHTSARKKTIVSLLLTSVKLRMHVLFFSRTDTTSCFIPRLLHINKTPKMMNVHTESDYIYIVVSIRACLLFRFFIGRNTQLATTLIGC